MGERACSTCGQVWLLTSEHWRTRDLKALLSDENKSRQCKNCRAKRAQSRRKKYEQLSKVKTYRSEYRNRPEVKAHIKAYNQKRNQKPEIKARNAEKKRNYLAIKREELRQWEIENEIPLREKKMTEQEIVATNNYRAATANVEATLTDNEWLAVLKAFDFSCAYCGGEYQVLEHIIPVSAGGGTTVDNCVPACYSCNARKRDMLPDELDDFQAEVIATMWQHLFWVVPLENEDGTN